ncbi:MAG TPA: phosphoadenosine phosphosulfate reductase family protein [Verrucomicrobiae bacterium]|nr:phosphoadenosine phosphosulfate reductase family protein [Verrucomicrobiae bacterium]
MTDNEISKANIDLDSRSPAEIVRWAIARSQGRAIVSTNFRPYEAVLLHLCVQEQPDIPALWVDHGYNRPATYRHAEQLKKLLNLNLKSYLPTISVAHRNAIFGDIPSPDDEPGLKQFSAQMKLEPFRRGMRELAPTVWITALRKTQNPGRAAMAIVSEDKNFGAIKVSPVLNWTDAQMEDYLSRHHLPIEWDYFDPAKSDEKRECGLHAAWGADAVVSAGAGI